MNCEKFVSFQHLLDFGRQLRDSKPTILLPSQTTFIQFQRTHVKDNKKKRKCELSETIYNLIS